jgi:hypothetical protein
MVSELWISLNFPLVCGAGFSDRDLGFCTPSSTRNRLEATREQLPRSGLRARNNFRLAVNQDLSAF